jgi:adenylosuccinate synthase
MPLDIVIGSQWGDEGKGRIIDLLAGDADIVARFNGGDNAGHSVTVADQLFKLHLIPSGIIQPNTICVMGAGMVVNPQILLEEVDHLTQLGIDASPQRLKLSYAAHLITPAHTALDGAEESEKGQGLLGTTRRGIGPTYADKATRIGLRAEDLLNEDLLHQKLDRILDHANRLLEHVYNKQPLDKEPIQNGFLAYADRLRPYIANVGALVHDKLNRHGTVLAEGAQGTLLDLDHGTYPFVTSSHPTAPGALLGLGIGPQHIRRIIGITKSFQTRVGEGPFPTEASGDTAARLRGTGEHPWDEFGTTTGRPRRCGWLDTVLLRYTARINGFTEIALTKLDILSNIDPLNICVSYQRGDQQFKDLPQGPADLSPFKPVFDPLPGWETDLTQIRSWNDLPSPARSYIERVETLTGLSVRLISVGPERDQIIDRSLSE